MGVDPALRLLLFSSHLPHKVVVILLFQGCLLFVRSQCDQSGTSATNAPPDAPIDAQLSTTDLVSHSCSRDRFGLEAYPQLACISPACSVPMCGSQEMPVGELHDGLTDRQSVHYVGATLETAPAPASYVCVRLKGQGLGADEVDHANKEVIAAINALKYLLEDQPTLEIRAAETEAQLFDALKLYRDMNHLSLTGVTCDQVVEHVLSHTVLLLYRAEPSAAPICVSAATFTMRQNTMMLRLLATHPRMTRKGFGRITVHFLKELCRALHKEDILVYTYPSSSPFYKALHFRHTHPHIDGSKPSVETEPDAQSSREARRAFSARDNEMIFQVQPSMAQVLARTVCGASAAVVHPYACTRRRAGATGEAAPVVSEVRRHQLPSTQRHAAQIAALDAHHPTIADVESSRARTSATACPPLIEPSSSTVLSAAEEGYASVEYSARYDQSDAKLAEGICPASCLTGASPVLVSQCHPNDPDTPRDGVNAASASGTTLPTVSAAAQAAKAILANATATSRAARAATERPPGHPEFTAATADVESESPRKRSRFKAKDVYQVEKIIDVKHDTADVKYLIKWKGWPAKYNTWEPVQHLQNLQAEIKAFESSRPCRDRQG